MKPWNRQITAFPDRPSASPNRQLIANRFAVIVNRAALKLSTNHQQNAGVYHAGLRLAAPKVRRVTQPICRQFADHHWEFADSADFGFVESTDNLPIFPDNLPIFVDWPSSESTDNLPIFYSNLPMLLGYSVKNQPKIDRRKFRIDRSGSRNRSVESSRNHQIAPNQVGNIYTGHSMAVDPLGRTLADLGDKEGLAVVELNLSLVAEVREKLPLLQNRRADVYARHAATTKGS